MAPAWGDWQPAPPDCCWPGARIHAWGTLNDNCNNSATGVHGATGVPHVPTAKTTMR